MARDFLSGLTLRGKAPFILTFSVPGTLAVGVGAARWYAHRPLTIVNVSLSLGVAPAGASVIFDLNRNGTTVFTTQGNRPTVAAAGFTDLASVPDVTSIAEGDYLTVDCDQIGSTTPGSHAVLQVHYL